MKTAKNSSTTRKLKNVALFIVCLIAEYALYILLCRQLTRIVSWLDERYLKGIFLYGDKYGDFMISMCLALLLVFGVAYYLFRRNSAVLSIRRKKIGQKLFIASGLLISYCSLFFVIQININPFKPLAAAASLYNTNNGVANVVVNSSWIIFVVMCLLFPLFLLISGAILFHHTSGANSPDSGS